MNQQLLLMLWMLNLFDVYATFLTLFLDQKKGCYDHTREKNLIFRKVFKSGISPIKFIFTWMFSFSLLNFLYFVGGDMFGYMMFGVYFLITYMHIHNILDIDRNWNNVELWILKQKMIKVKI